MALVTCPKCEKQISDTSKKCVHCETDLIKCPECNSLLVDSNEFCPICGYALKSTPSQDTEKKDVAPDPLTSENPELLHNVVTRFRKENIPSKILGAITTALGVLVAIAIAVMIGLTLMIWVGMSDLSIAILPIFLILLPLSVLFTIIK